MLLASVAFARSVLSEPSPCCTPEQWEGMSNNFFPGVYYTVGKTAYDYKNKQFYYHGIVKHMMGRSRYNVTILALHSNSSLYFVSDRSGEEKCRRFDLKDDMKEACIPQNATYLDAITLGGALDCDVWRFGCDKDVADTITSFDGMKASVFSVVASDGCIPVKNAYHYMHFGLSVVDTQDFWNITPGIKDKTIFDVPESCMKASVSGSLSHWNQIFRTASYEDPIIVRAD
jgi:hypothetical protein